MRHICLLIVAIVLLPVLAAAQGPAGAGASGPHASATSFSRAEYTPWELGIGYQYNRVNLIGQPFDTDGVNVTITRFFGRWFGLDGQVGVGFFGNTGLTTNPPNLGVSSVFIGGGPRLAYRNRSRIEPWIHAVVGLQDFHFTQTANTVLGSNKALGAAGGAGVDFLITSHVAIRMEVDVIETHFFSAYQRHFQGVGGFVFNF